MNQTSIPNSAKHASAESQKKLQWSDIQQRASIRLYAGAIPEMSEYDGWAGLSIEVNDDRHLLHDITTPIPLPDNSVDAFQAEDVFEHIQYNVLVRVVNEIFRILKPGGYFRLSVPDYRCKILRDRSEKDQHGNLVFDPAGGGTVDDPGHVWFPVYESVKAIIEKSQFAVEGEVNFYHYYDESGKGITRPIDYSKGNVRRTPDHDERVKAQYCPLSIVVDMVKKKAESDAQGFHTEYHGTEYGGWAIVPENLNEASIVYSFGIGEDISFDLSLIQKYGVNVVAFDPTPKSIRWLNAQALPEKFRWHEYGLAHFNGTVKFYPPENPDHVSHTIAYRSSTAERYIEVPVKTFSTICRELGHSKIDILKMDIEGAEYSVIDDIVGSGIAITQILVEFHDRFEGFSPNSSRTAIRTLERHGYEITAISSTGNEYSFIKRSLHAKNAVPQRMGGADVPVVLIAYNRPQHTKEVLASLKSHDVKNLYVFCDAPRSEKDRQSVEATRKLIREIDWTTPVVTYQTANQGLARSIVQAADVVFEKYDRLILLEDDCVPQAYFFDFMYACLERYKDNERIFGISGYSVPVPEALRQEYPYDLYFTPRIGSWGWATWKRAWQKKQNDLGALRSELTRRGIDLEQGGDDVPSMLDQMIRGTLKDVWTMSWILTVYLNKGYYIYPTESHIKNIGMDGSGVHCGATDKFDTLPATRKPTRYPFDVLLDRGLYENFRSFYDQRPAVRRAEGTQTAAAPGLAQPSAVTESAQPSRRAMKVVHLCMQDFGGAGTAAYRLHRGLVEIGVNSTMLVFNKQSKDPTVKVLPSSFNGPTQCLEAETYSSPAWAEHWTRWTNIHQAYPNRPSGLEVFSDLVTDVKLEMLREIQEADVINLHWVAGMLDVDSLSRLSKRKILVWTLHDMNAFTGGCHYTNGCEKYRTACAACPQLGSSSASDLSSEAWQKKRSVYAHADIHVVTPSEWLARCARESSLFAKFPVDVIPYGFPLDVFTPDRSRSVRHELKLQPQAKLITFVADYIGNRRKGIHLLFKALQSAKLAKYRNRITFGIVGNQSGEDLSRLPFAVHQFGSISDPRLLARIYSASDVFVIPSLEDNLPNTVVEALASGVPVVGFDIGGIPDMITHKETGYLARPADPESLAKGILWVIEHSDERFSVRCRESAERRYALHMQADAYSRLYRRLAPVTSSLPAFTDRITEAESAMERGEWPVAKEHLRSVLAVDPGHIDALNDLSVVELTMGNLAEAVELITKVLEKDPLNEIAIGNLAYLQEQLQSTPTSEAPMLLQDRLALAEARIAEGNLPEAHDTLRACLDQEPQNIDVLNDLSVVSMMMMNYDEAAAYLSRVLAITPDNAIALENAKILRQMLTDIVSDQATDSGEAFPDGTPAHSVTIGNFSDFTYAKQRHFSSFGDNDLKLFHTKIDPSYADLKAYQDLLVFTFIKNNIPPGSKILDIGGGDSRILRYFSTTYECWNLDKLEGVGNGPRDVDHYGYRLVKDYIGNFNDELPEEYFDFIFSISALEHVPYGLKKHEHLFENICLDMDRILKPGGVALHVFDITVSEKGSGWTNDLAPFMQEFFKGEPSMIPFDTLLHDPELYVISERYFNDYWKGAPSVGEYENGKPTSWNILWQKPIVPSSEPTKKQWRWYQKLQTPIDPAYPKISVVTPSFNQAEFLEACIVSALGQHYPNLEYIILDGGSTDGSVEIIRRYGKCLAYWQSQPDGGQYAAINAGLSMTSGEIMTWLNSDDKFHPNAFRSVAEIFTSHADVEWIMGRPNGFAPDGTQEWVFDYLPEWSRERYLNGQYANPYIQQEGTFWRRTLWEKAGGRISTELKLAGDLELWARFFRYAQLHTIDTLLAGFRRQPNQQTSLHLENYHKEADAVIAEERRIFEHSTDKVLLPAPPIITLQANDKPTYAKNDRPRGKYDVSAIVSVYNAERFIQGCLDDLLGQTLYEQGKLEIVLVNSGSQQNEDAIIRDCQRRFQHITYIATRERETVYQAWNRGIKAASGKYITNANTDDRHAPDALERLAAVLDSRPEISIVYADSYVTQHESDTWNKCSPKSRFAWPESDTRTLFDICFLGPHPMWRKSLHEAYGYFDERYRSAGDYDFWLKLAVHNERMLHIPEVLGIYLENQESISLSDGSLNWTESERARDAHWPAAWGKRPATAWRSCEVPCSPEAGRPGSSVKKLLLVCDYFWPSVGGVELYIEDLGLRLQGHGYRVDVACRAVPGRPALRHAGMTIHEVALLKDRTGAVDAGVIRAFKQLVMGGGYDSVIALSQPDNWIGLGLSDLPAPHPQIIMMPSISASNLTEWGRNGLAPAVIKFLRSVDHVVTVSEHGYDASFIANAGIASTFIPHAAEHDADAGDFRAEYGFSATDTLFVMVANFWPVKNHDELIDAMRSYPGSWHLAIIGNEVAGEEEYHQRVVELAKADERITIIGGLPRAKAAAAIRDADVLLVPSKAESAGPLVVLQAMSYGTPWIATPSCNAVRDEAGGLIAPVAHFPKAIDFLLSQKERHDAIIEAGKAHWERSFRWMASLPMFVSLIERAPLPRALTMDEDLRRASWAIQEAFEKEVDASEPDYSCIFSVIIPTYNRIDILKKCLRALAKQTFPLKDFEVIVCDDGSTDNTTAAVRKMKVPFRLTYLRQENKGPAAARNMGIKRASGKYLLILNDDALLEPDAMQIHYDLHMRHRGEKLSVLGAFTYLPQYTETFIGRLAATTDILFDYPNMVSGSFYDFNHFYTCNISLLKKSAQEIGLFDEHFTGPAAEDVEFGYRLEQAGYTVLYESSCIAWHDHALTVDSFCRVHETRGFGAVTLALRQPGAFSLSYLTRAIVGQWKNEVTTALSSIEKIVAVMRTWEPEKNKAVVEKLAVESLEHVKLLQQFFRQKGMLSNPLLEELLSIPDGSGTRAAEEPLISVVIPCYNYAEYLPECVESVVRQTLTNWEIIIVNDGSTDNSLDVAKALIAKYPQHAISVIDQANSGQPAISRNNGIAAARGTFILPLDADDVLDPRMLEATYNELRRTNSDVVYTDQEYFNVDRRIVRTWDFDRKLLFTQNYFAYCSLYKKAMWKAVGGYKHNVRGYEDWEFWITCAEAGYVFRRLPEVLFRYRVKEESMITSALSRDKELKAQIILYHPAIYSRSDVEAARRFIAHGAAAETVSGASAAQVAKAFTESRFRVVAIVSAYNEGDVIRHVIGDLIANGLEVYLLDNNSTDNTVEEASAWLGKGLLHIEKFPDDCGYPARSKREYVWKDILRRKEELAQQLGADWYIHTDADEFRESPFLHTTLAQGIELVDRLGFNAINFDLFNFRPTDNSFVPGTDVRDALLLHERGKWLDGAQIKAWKNTGTAVDIAANGGHNIMFDGRRVFPVPFILRHYPIRSEEHGRRKVMQERVARFNQEERALGWHVQYDKDIAEKKSYLYDPADLLPYRREEVCADLFSNALKHILIMQTGHAENVRASEKFLRERPDDPEAVRKLLDLNLWLHDFRLAEKFLDRFAELAPDHHALPAYMHAVSNRVGTASASEQAGPDVMPSSAKVQEEPPAKKFVPGLTSIIVLTYNGLKYTMEFVDSVKQHTRAPYELIVIDNASTDGTRDYLSRLAETDTAVRVILNEANAGFPAGVNQGLRAATGEYLMIANNDIVVTDGWLERMIEIAGSDPEIGIVGPMSNAVSGAQIDKNARYKTMVQMHAYAKKVRAACKGELLSFPRVAFLCTLITRRVIDSVGGLDEIFTPGNFEDDDYCLRAQLSGFKTVIAKDCFIHHHGSKSFLANGQEAYRERLRVNEEKFVAKWGATPDEIWLQGRSFTKAPLSIALNPDTAAETLRHAEELIHRGEFGQARVVLDELLAASPGHIGAMNNLSVLEIMNKNWMEAAVCINKVLEFDPANETARHNLQYLDQAITGLNNN